MTFRVNGSLDKSTPVAAPEKLPLEPGWREHFLNLLNRSPRFPGPRHFLRRDIASALGNAIHRDASVLEAGVGNGKLLASLPNAVR